MTINEKAGARRKLRKECRTSRRTASHMREGPPSVDLFGAGAEEAVPSGSAHCQIDCRFVAATRRADSCQNGARSPLKPTSNAETYERTPTQAGAVIVGSNSFADEPVPWRCGSEWLVVDR